MDSALTTIGLPIALAIIMFGLGLGLDRSPTSGGSAKHPKAVVVALVCQLMLLPAVCFGLVVLFDLPPLLGIGMMLLAASPGGTSANLFSHLFHGDVALNISADRGQLGHLGRHAAADHQPRDQLLRPWRRRVACRSARCVKVFAIVLVPVAIGMLVRDRSRRASPPRMDRPVRIGSAVDPRDPGARASCSTSARTSATTSPTSAWSPRSSARSASSSGTSCRSAFGVVEDQAIASSMEIGVHNATLAIFVAVEVLDSTEISVPAAVYSIFMFVFAALWGMLLTRRTASDRVPTG